MNIRYLFVLLCLLPASAYSDMYMAVGKDGQVTYSNKPIKGGKKIILEPLPVMQPTGHASSQEGFPKVDAQTQKGRDETRRKILEDELIAEEKLLEEAKQNLREGEENPEVFQVVVGKNPNGSPIVETRRNVPKYDEKIKGLKEQVELHQQNVGALKAELSKIK